MRLLCNFGRPIRVSHEDMTPVTGWIDDKHFSDRPSQATRPSQTIGRAAGGCEKLN